MDHYDDHDDNFGREDDHVPETVKDFVISLNQALADRDRRAIKEIYSYEFNSITDKYYKASMWPSANAVQHLFTEDYHVLFYQELCDRHAYATSHKVDCSRRFQTYENYIKIFNVFLGLHPADPQILIPSVWLWDIVDEFIFQFQHFHRYRHRVKYLREENKKNDLEMLQQNKFAWSARTVITYLYALVNKGREDEDDEEPVHGLFKTLAQFSLIGLLRVHCLLGDYTGALEVLDPIDLKSKDNPYLHEDAVAAHVSLYYHMGFCYLMLRRYMDAKQTFSYFLFINRYHTMPQSYQEAVIAKKVEQMKGLLCIAVCLCPQPLDESLHLAINDKYKDERAKMQAGDESAYTDVFKDCCPKFITASDPDYNTNLNTDEDAEDLQVKIFRSEVKQRAELPQIKSYLKMCTSVSTTKLANFLGKDKEDTLGRLVALKHKTRNKRWAGGAPREGKWVASSDVDFFVTDDMVHVAENVSQVRYADYFIHQISKYETLQGFIEQIPPRE